MRGRLASAAGDAAIVVAAATILGIGGNLLRDEPLALLPHEPPPVLVPCPEGGAAEALEPAEVRPATDLLVDARPREAHAAWHPEGALSVPYDFLDPVSEEAVREILDAAASGGRARVVVYGDGDRPDTGMALARELAGRGVRHVYAVTGGAPALRAALEGSP